MKEAADYVLHLKKEIEHLKKQTTKQKDEIQSLRYTMELVYLNWIQHSLAYCCFRDQKKTKNLLYS